MGDRVTGTREDPIPLRTDILDLIGPVAPDPSVPVLRQDAATWDQLGETSIFDEVRSWCALVETEAAEDGQDFTWEDRRTLTGAVAYLTGHLSWVAAQPWVDELIAAVRKLARDAHRVAPWRAETMRDTEPCDRCGVRAVVLHVAESTLVCERRMGGCGKATVSDYLRQSRRAG